MVNTENIQANKKILVFDRKTKKVYTGEQARGLIGLPNRNTRGRPDHNPKYDIFVQSTSHNRVLLPNTKVIVVP